MVPPENDEARKDLNRTEITIRPYRTDDFSELWAMVLALYNEDPQGETISVGKVRATEVTLSRNPDRGSIVLFEVRHGIVGYAILIYYWSNEYGGDLVSIDELYVKPDWRNRSIGTMFINDLQSRVDRDFKGLQLEVTPRNKRALAYYKRLGFKESQNVHLLCQTKVH